MRKLAGIFLAIGITAAATSLTMEQLNQGDKFPASFQTGDSKVNVRLEVANTTGELENGLMYRKHLPEKHGMLFIFEEPRNRSFWMKNTYIPLDIIFIDHKGEIINIEQADPEPNTSEEELERYRSRAPAKYVVEMKQGFAEKYKIQEDDSIDFGERLEKCCVTPQ